VGKEAKTHSQEHHLKKEKKKEKSSGIEGSHFKLERGDCSTLDAWDKRGHFLSA